MPDAAFDVAVDLKKVGATLRSVRQHMELSSRQLAGLSGVSAAHILRMEAGRDFTITKLVKVCGALGVPPATAIETSLVFSVRSLAEEVKAFLAENPDIQKVCGDRVERVLGLLDFTELLLNVAARVLFSAAPVEEAEVIAQKWPWLREPVAALAKEYGGGSSLAHRATAYWLLKAIPFSKLKTFGLLTPETLRHWQRVPGTTGPAVSAQKRSLATIIHIGQLSPMQIATKLKKVRKALGMTAEQAAAHWGIPVSTLRKWEGKFTKPRGLALRQLETILRTAEQPPG